MFCYDQEVQGKILDFEKFKEENFENNYRRPYLTREGIKYPSVSTVLYKGTDQSWKEKWIEKVGQKEADRISKEATKRGTNIHEITEKYLLNDEKWNENLNYIEKSEFGELKPVLDENVGKIYGLEVSIYSDLMKTCGRADMIAEWGNKNSIVDFKTSKKEKKKEWIGNYFLQSAAYSYMAYETYGVFCPQIVILIAVDHCKPQIFVDRAKNWIPKFLEIREKVSKEHNI